MLKLKITPRFSTKEIIDSTIKKDWFLFQLEAHNMGIALTAYMQSYINSNRKRRGGTGNLAKTIKFYPLNTAGVVSWGIGSIAELNQQAKYWYVVNYGKKITGEAFVPYNGKFTPGSFEGSRPNPAFAGGQGVQHFNKGDGSGFGLKAKSAIRPINYIESTRHKLMIDMNRLLARLKGVK